MDNDENIKYIQITIDPRNKALIYPVMAGIWIDKDYNVVNKYADYFIYMIDIDDHLTYSESSSIKGKEHFICMCMYNYYNHHKKNEYPSLESVLAEIKSTRFGCYAKVVDTPEIHALQYSLFELD